MYDTLKIFIPILNILNPNYIELFESILTNKEHRTFENGGYLLKGYYKNFYINLNQSGIKIEGSIHKYIKGFNLETTTLKEFENAIFELSNKFQLDLMQGIVWRLDYAHNINVEYKPETYFTQFESAPRMNRVLYKTGNVDFINKSKEFAMYDKILDAKNKKQTIGNEWTNKNLVRLEVRFKKRISKRFNVQQLLVSELLKPNFIEQIHQYWINEYYSIKRAKNINMNEKKLTAKEMQELATAFMLQTNNDFVEKLKATAKTPKEWNRFKNKFNKLLGKESENELQIELDKKVNDIKPILS